MATYHALAATSRGILKLLSDAAGGSEFAGTEFKLIQSSTFEKPSTDCVTLYPYRVAVSTSQRNRAPRRLPNGRRTRPPLPVDLSYLLTVWVSDPHKQLQLLGWCIRILEDTPILPAALLNVPPEEGTFRPDETIEIICDPTISLQDMANIWEAMKPAQLSVGYVARMIDIESLEFMTEAPIVQTREFNIVKGQEP